MRRSERRPGSNRATYGSQNNSLHSLPASNRNQFALNHVSTGTHPKNITNQNYSHSVDANTLTRKYFVHCKSAHELPQEHTLHQDAQDILS